MNTLDVQGLRVDTRLADISFQLQAGEMLGLIGPNGAGKSTLLNCLANLQPYQGSVLCDGHAVAAFPDPVGAVEQLQRRPSGILVGRMRIPLGVICMIYESRPNVTIDAAALCLKSGNAVILRGGSEALRSNLALATIFHELL